MKELSDKNKPQKLEDVFRMSLEEAEVSPSDRVWERIEQGLNSQEAGYYKERVGWYRTLAAACIFLVVCAAGFLYYDISHTHSAQNPIAQQPTPPPATIPANPGSKVPVPAVASKPAVAQPEATLSLNTKFPAATKLAQTQPKRRTGKNLPAPETQNNLTPGSNQANNTQTKVIAGVNGDNENNTLAQAKNSISEPAGVTENPLPQEIIASANQLPSALKSVNPGLPTSLGPATVMSEMKLLPEKAQAEPNALALLPEPASGQNEKLKAPRWSLSAKYAPQYFNQNIQLVAQTKGTSGNSLSPTASFSAPNAGNVASTSYAQALNEYDNNTSAGFSYNTSVAAGYVLNEHWSLESGLNFTQNVAKSSSSFIFNNTNLAARYNLAAQNLNLNDNKVNADPIGILPATALLASLSGQQNVNSATVVQTPTFDTQYRYRLLGIPVRINYQTSQRKSFYFASVGFLTNMLVQAQVLSGSPKVPDLKFQGQTESPFRTWQFAATVSAGKGFRISKAINLRAGLEGTQNLNSLAAHPEYLSGEKGKPYTIGVAFSSSYTLGL